MSEQKDYWMTTDDQGSIKISEDVIASIASVAALETEGVSGLYSSITSDIVSFLSKKNPTKGVKVTFHVDNTVDVSVCYYAVYGSNIYNVAKQVQDSVKSAIEAMTGLKTGSINISVGGVAFPALSEKSSDENDDTQDLISTVETDDADDFSPEE